MTYSVRAGMKRETGIGRQWRSLGSFDCQRASMRGDADQGSRTVQFASGRVFAQLGCCRPAGLHIFAKWRAIDSQPSLGEVARMLRSHDETRERAEQRVPSRSLWLFMLWGAVVMAAYVGVFLFSFGGRSLEEATPELGTYSTSLLVFPILLLSVLVSGTRERFGVRTTPSPRYWIVAGIILASFLALLVLAVIGIGYPWWLTMFLPVALFAVMAFGPIRQLRKARTPDDERWVNEPLSRPARWTTVVIGITLGAVATASPQPWFPVVQVVASLLILVAIVGYRSRWGLARTGFEWGPIHWVAFAVTVGILFGLTALLVRTDWITTWVAVALGVIAAAIMVITALLPTRARRD